MRQSLLYICDTYATLCPDMNLKDTKPKVAVFLESAYLTNRELLKGFLKYTRLHGAWTPILRTGRDDEPTQRAVRLSECAAIVTDRLDASIRRAARAGHIPVITVLCDRRTPEVVVNVTCDDDSVAVLAADHLIARGFKSFAYVGGTTRWSRVRGAAFRRTLVRRGLRCALYRQSGQPLADFLAALKPPVGVFAANDVLAQPVFAAAAAAGLSVPNDIAIVGVDNDEVLCESTEPALTSICWNTEDTGYRLGELVDRTLLADRFPKFHTMTYCGSNVVPRASTAHRTDADWLIRRCRSLMEINAPGDLSVANLAVKLNVSRRTLERRFRLATGKSLGDAIVDLRLERAESFLRTTDLPQHRIATECGFYDASHMNAVFKRRRHALPSVFR